jgi:PadR family transcriptional regulator, regulatory protein PadR
MARQASSDRQTQWLRGVLDLAVLATLSQCGRSYGYALLQELGNVGVDLKGGTLYPLLARLEQDGLVETEWAPGEGGPGRKWFTITQNGRQVLRDGTYGWTEFAGRISAILPATTTRGDRDESCA